MALLPFTLPQHCTSKCFGGLQAQKEPASCPCWHVKLSSRSPFFREQLKRDNCKAKSLQNSGELPTVLQIFCQTFYLSSGHEQFPYNNVFRHEKQETRTAKRTTWTILHVNCCTVAAVISQMCDAILIAHPQIASDGKKFLFASDAKTHSLDLKSQENARKKACENPAMLACDAKNRAVF